MLNKIFIVKLLFLYAEPQAIIKATEKNFPSFVSLTDGKEPLNNFEFSFPTAPSALSSSLAPSPNTRFSQHIELEVRNASVMG